MARVRSAIEPLPRAARLFGRDGVLDELRQAMAAGARATLVGPSGAGKTEIALHLLATAEVDEHLYVDLGAARDAEDVVALIANALDVRAGRDPVATLRAAIGARGCLLVLDRCDAARDEIVAFVGALAGACSVLCVAAEPLFHPEERVVALEPLAEAGVELFFARAEQHGGDLPWGSRARAVVGRVVDRCGGLPLAIELAAAVDRDPSRVADELDAVDPRRPLRGVVSWALSSLSPVARDALAQASVFEGTDAEPVDVLSALVDRGLIARAPGRLDASRLVVPTVVRAAALELLGDGERVRVLRRHASHMAESAARSDERADLIAAHEVALVDREIPAVIAARLASVCVPRLLREGAVVRAQAIADATLSRARAEHARQDAGLSSALHVARALVAEARGEDPSAHLRAATDSPRVRLASAEIALRRGDPDAAIATLGARDVPPDALAVRTLRALGDAHRRAGAPAEAARVFRRAMEVSRHNEPSVASAELLVRLAGVELDLGAPDRAQPHLASAIDVLSRARALRPWAIALATLADLLEEEGDDVGVDALLGEARALAERVGAIDVVARVDVLAGARALSRGDVAGARAAVAAAVSGDTCVELARAIDGAARARCDDRHAARASIGTGAVASILLGAVDLSEARRARVCGADPVRHDTSARARLATQVTTTEARIARRVLARLMETPAPVIVAIDGRRVVVDGAEVSFERRANLRRLVAALLRQRVEQPAAPIAPRALFAAGWPGERVPARVADDRLHTALQTLRDLGLRTLLQSIPAQPGDEAGGWRLDPETPIDVA
ncbi:MAG: hypothetical protein HYV09_28760 [Deltaproteobacteria bacterium]|nr:hypothetical protein [Deltaproteobacteria bacterium]